MNKIILAIFIVACCSFLAIEEPSLKNGEKVYAKECLLCHMKDGGGVPHLNPPLAQSSKVVSADENYLIKTILKGMNARVEIDGEYYSNNMASFARLSDKDIADVLSYIRNSFGNKASFVTEIEVKTQREKLKIKK